MMGSPDGFGAQLTPGIPWASGLEIANPRLMRTTMCRTTTVTGILNNVSCDGAKHHVEATWNKGFMSMLLPSKKEVMEMVIKTNMIRLSKNDDWYVGTIQLGWVLECQAVQNGFSQLIFL